MHNTNKQLNREAKWAVLLSLGYLVGWIIFAYLLPQGHGLLGFPLWFEMSCIFLPVLFILVALLVIKGVYQDIDLEEGSHE
ncbi:hypothetical protein A4G20_08440 [Pasteurellaceae bacterium RH1A]|nr:hypothetical protein A4G20_08440 [Pasteurellaceae bacterium RH1A]